ncbi:hypothetical protein [Thermomonas alba]|uniref:hypothetical protein n=1 Tax=Thermomonas alba TaxID=2888525 RepID=UPI001F04F39E|nr:hypothetical protein [Thermomonas alba]
MALTLGITGMERHTETEVTAAFKVANAEIGGLWTLTDSEHADYVIIDMDSLYGPMSWLRLHAMGRKVIGLTSVDRQQTDYRLPHPISASDLAVLLSEIATDTPLLTQAAVEIPSTASASDEVAPAAPTVAPPASPAAEASESLDAPATPGPAPTAGQQTTETPALPAAQAPQARPLRDWLAAGRPAYRVRLQPPEAPALLLDLPNGQWYGPSALKPLAAHFSAPLLESDFTALDEAAWAAESARLGPPQPVTRLLWLGGLLSGAPVAGPYVLKKWPQTEREYPRHFRIATVMMKGPADADAIAAAAGVSREEVVEFINANLATGYAEPVRSAPPPEPASSKPAGLFGRLRGH